MGGQANSDESTRSPGTGSSGGNERQQGGGHARRAVILGAAAAGAGAVAGLALPAGAAAAATTPATEPLPLQLTVAVQSSITLSEINTLISRIGGLVGCTPCGMIGIDLRLFGVDPAEISDIQSIEAIAGVASATALQF